MQRRAYECPKCGRTLYVASEETGTALECEFCGVRHTVGREHQPAAPPERKEPESRDDVEEQDDLAPARKGLLILSVVWIACLCIPAVNSSGLAIVMTLGIVLTNFAFSLVHLIFPPRRVLGWLSAAQLVLFCFVNYQLYAAVGEESYRFDGEPNVLDWVQLTVVHLFRAADVPDAMEAYGISWQTVHPNSPWAGCVLVLFHVCCDIFLVTWLIQWIKVRQSLRRALRDENRSSGSLRKHLLIPLTAIGLTLAILIPVVSSLDSELGIGNLFLWPLDNMLRAVDFADAMYVFGMRLHSVPPGILVDTLGLALRLFTAILLVEAVNKLLPGIFSSVQGLILLLNHRDRRVVLKAIRALADLGADARSAIPHLIVLLVVPIKKINAQALHALKKIDPNWQASPLRYQAIPSLVIATIQPKLSTRASKMLQRIDPSWPANRHAVAAVRLLLGMTLSDDTHEREQSSDALDLIDPNWRDKYRRRLAAKRSRAQMAQTLGKFPGVMRAGLKAMATRWAERKLLARLVGIQHVLEVQAEFIAIRSANPRTQKEAVPTTIWFDELADVRFREASEFAEGYISFHFEGELPIEVVFAEQDNQLARDVAKLIGRLAADAQDKSDERPATGVACPKCGSNKPPITKTRVSGTGWTVFFCLLIGAAAFCWAGLLIREEFQQCPKCGRQAKG